MKMRFSMRTAWAATLATALLALLPGVCGAADIKVLCALGMKEVVEDLGPQFERASGHKLIVAFANLGNIMKRIEGGEAAELVILPRQGIARLVKSGRATAANTAVLARGGTGVAVRKGARKPDISSPDAFKRALLAASSMTYLDPAGGGVTGVHVVKVLDRLGIADAMKPKTVLHRNSSEAAALIAAGKAEIGINLIQELLPKPGIDLVGPLPGDLQLSIPYAAAIMNGASNAVAAKALIDFVRSAAAAAVIKTRGMEPG
jgi:molybdate transport system substrate-binding protein